MIKSYLSGRKRTRACIVFGLLAILALLVFAVFVAGCGGPEEPTPTEQRLAEVPPGAVVASSRWGVYHSPGCEEAKKIPVDDLVVFDTVREAKDAFCKPCAKCQADEAPQ